MLWGGSRARARAAIRVSMSLLGGSPVLARGVGSIGLLVRNLAHSPPDADADREHPRNDPWTSHIAGVSPLATTCWWPAATCRRGDALARAPFGANAPPSEHGAPR